MENGSKRHKMKYVVCQKKRNNPRMPLPICIKKCDMKEECPGYTEYKLEFEKWIRYTVGKWHRI
jgi:hypothetical protein